MKLGWEATGSGVMCEGSPYTSGLETVNEFTERMRTAINEAKSAICKAQDDMKRYYDRQRIPAPVRGHLHFHP